MFGTTTLILDGKVVSGCLVGLPAEGGRSYTVGIPKGDTHDWCDRKLSFWGRLWRTMGIPETAEQQNIPLCWGQNVTVRLHEGAEGVTVYENGNFLRHFYTDAEYTDLRGSKTDKVGAQPAGDVSVLIYSCTDTDGYLPRAGDMILRGECAFEFDTADERSASESMRTFREAHPAFAVIKEVSAEKNGLKNDLRITAR